MPDASVLEEKLNRLFPRILNEKKSLHPSTDTVVMLVGPATKNEEGIYIKTPEDIARIRYCIRLIREAIATQKEKQASEITANDFASGPQLVLNGEYEKLGVLLEIALAEGFPAQNIQLVDCGVVGECNTKTQFVVMQNDVRYSKCSRIAFISSSYHVPRVLGTGKKNFASSDFDVHGVPLEEFHEYNTEEKVAGEIKRILSYLAKGDIVDPTPFL